MDQATDVGSSTDHDTTSAALPVPSGADRPSSNGTGPEASNGNGTDPSHERPVRGPRRFIPGRFLRGGSNDAPTETGHDDPTPHAVDDDAADGTPAFGVSRLDDVEPIALGSTASEPVPSEPAVTESDTAAAAAADADDPSGPQILLVDPTPASGTTPSSIPPAPPPAPAASPSASPAPSPAAPQSASTPASPGVPPPAPRSGPTAAAPVVPPPAPPVRHTPQRGVPQRDVPGRPGVDPTPSAGVFVDPDSTAEILKRPQRPSRPIQQPVAVRRPPKTRVRRVTRVVRHVDTWSVFKIAGVFNLFMLVVLLTSGVLLWQVAVSTGTIDNVERGFENVGWEVVDLKSKGGEIFHNAWIAGLFVAVGLTGLAVMMATLFNLITDLVGGMRVTVLEEEIRTRDDRQVTIPQPVQSPVQSPVPSPSSPGASMPGVTPHGTSRGRRKRG